MVYGLSILCFLFFLTVGPSTAFASPNVFYIKKSLKMENDEKPQHDYYINAGSQQGLKSGMLIKVQRKVPFQDTAMVKTTEQLEIPVVELKLIHVQSGLSVGRVHRRLIDKTSPILDYTNVMMGDVVNLGSKRWPKKGEKSVSKVTTKAKAKVATKAVNKKAKEGKAELSSVSPKPTPKAKETKSVAVDKKEDQQAKAVPVGGEFQPKQL